MCITQPLPRSRASPGLAAMVLLCVLAPAPFEAVAAGPPVANGAAPSRRPWILKVTPIYDGSLERIEILYRHRPRPYLLRAGAAEETFVRPTIRIDSAGGEAWLGLDADLAWEGRCSQAGQWLVIDADRSGPGLSGANLRYNLRTRRLIVSSGSSQVLVDLTDGSIDGPATMVGRCKNLRDHFLNHGNRPFRVRVSDRPGSSGMVWLFDDLASVAVGPADQPWFGRPEPGPEDPSTVPWPPPPKAGAASSRAVNTTLPLLEPPKPLASPDGRPTDQKWAFGSPSPRPVRSGPASPARPRPLSCWPGKDLPPLPPGGAAPLETDRTRHLLDELSRHWRGRADRVGRVAQGIDRVVAGIGLARLDENRVEACAASIAMACGFQDGRLVVLTGGDRGDHGVRAASLSRHLRQLDAAIDKALTEARRSIESARGLTRHAADLAEAERNCRALAVGTSLSDEVVCLLMDLAVDGRPLHDRPQITALVAQRLLGRARDEVLARLWDRADLLTTASIDGGLDQPWGRMPTVIDGQRVEGLNLLDVAADRALAALASAIYAAPLAARHFQRHLMRRFPDRFAITPADVARLVEDLADAGVLAPTGLEQLLAICRGARQERQALLTRAVVKARAAGRLAERAETQIDRAIARRSTDLAAARQAESDRRSAYVRQQNELHGLLQWICHTYADQIFGRADLTPRQRKRLILSTAAWWVRQWQMDLCWVALDFRIEIKRGGNLYAWRVYDLRIDLLDQPDPEAVAEERMARTAPPQVFPLGPIRLASGQVIVPRVLADLGPDETQRVAAATQPRVDAQRVAHAADLTAARDDDEPRMILPR